METQNFSLSQTLKKILLSPSNVALALVTLQVLQAAEPFYAFFVQLNFLVLGWGGICFLYDLFTRRTALNTRYTLFLALYLVFYTIGMLLNHEHNLIGNFKILAYAGLYLFVFYPGGNQNKQTREKELLRYNHTILLFSFIFSAVSLLMFFFQIHYKSADGILQGFQTPVLWGIYRNPNTGGMIAVLSIIMIFLNRSIYRQRAEGPGKILRIFYPVNLIIQYMYLLLCNSRGSLVTGLTVLAFSGAYLFYFYLKKGGKRSDGFSPSASACLSVCLAVGLLIGGYVGSNLVKHGLSYLPVTTELTEDTDSSSGSTQSSNTSSAALSSSGSQDKESSEKSSKPEGHVSVDREDTEGNFSTGRFLIWDAGLRSLAEKPLFGWGADNIGIAKLSVYPDKANSKHINTTNMHNGFLQILVANGILGFLPFIIAFILIWKDIARNLFDRLKGDKVFLLMTMVAGAVVICSAVENFILLNLSVMSVTLWFYLGQLAAIYAETDGNPRCLSLLHPFSSRKRCKK